MTERLFILDGNSLGMSCHQASGQLRAGTQQTGAIYGSVRSLRDILIQSGAAKTLVVWDGRSWRKDLVTDYKANREVTKEQRDMREAYKTQTPHIKAIYETLGVSQVQADNMEADDLAAIFAERMALKGTIIRLLTRDHDWLQLIRANVSWCDHKTGELVTESAFEEFTGYKSVRQFAESKALQGDRSDGIGGVGGIGEVKAKELLARWGSVDAFLNDLLPEVVGEKKTPKALRDFHTDPEKHAKFRQNMKLMDLTRTDQFPKPVGLKLRPGKLDPKAFRAKCVELGFHSIIAQLDKFILPFQTAFGETLVTS